MAIFDPFRRAMGIASPVEMGNALRERHAIEQSKNPEDRFASAVATAVNALPHDEAVRAFPALRDVPRHAADEIRWIDTARAARQVADDSLKMPVDSLDARLSKAVGERALSEAAETIEKIGRTRFGPDESVDAVLESRRRMVAHQTRAFMSTGRTAELNADMLAERMTYTADLPGSHTLANQVRDIVGSPSDTDRRTWLPQAHRARLAMAQTGVLSPRDTVEEAMNASAVGHMRDGAIAQTPRRAEHERLKGDARTAIVRAQMNRNAAAERSKAPALDLAQQLALHNVRTVSGTSPSPTDRARIGQAISDPGKDR